MSWKEKLFTLINTRFYTKEELDSKATVIFTFPSPGYGTYYLSIRNSSNDDIEYIDSDASFTSLHPGDDYFTISAEIPCGYYHINPIDESTSRIILLDENDLKEYSHNMGINLLNTSEKELYREHAILHINKTMIIDMEKLILDFQDTTQQEPEGS